MKVLYQHDVGRGVPLTMLGYLCADEGVEDDTAAFAQELLNGVLTRLPELDRVIAAKAKEWRLDRLANVDRNILRLAVYELTHGRDVPAGAAINEAVELAKVYGGPESGRFVNGVLGQVARDLGVPAPEAEPPRSAEAGPSRATETGPPQAEPSRSVEAGPSQAEPSQAVEAGPSLAEPSQATEAGPSRAAEAEPPQATEAEPPQVEPPQAEQPEATEAGPSQAEPSQAAEAESSQAEPPEVGETAAAGPARRSAEGQPPSGAKRGS